MFMVKPTLKRGKFVSTTKRLPLTVQYRNGIECRSQYRCAPLKGRNGPQQRLPPLPIVAAVAVLPHLAVIVVVVVARLVRRPPSPVEYSRVVQQTIHIPLPHSIAIVFHKYRDAPARWSVPSPTSSIVACSRMIPPSPRDAIITSLASNRSCAECPYPSTTTTTISRATTPDPATTVPIFASPSSSSIRSTRSGNCKPDGSDRAPSNPPSSPRHRQRRRVFRPGGFMIRTTMTTAAPSRSSPDATATRSLMRVVGRHPSTTIWASLRPLESCGGEWHCNDGVGTSTTTTIATTIAAPTERNVDRRGRLDRTTPSTTRYGGCERSALLLHHRRCPSRWRPKEGWVVVRWEDDCRVVASSSREGNLGGTRTTTTCRPTMP